MNFLAVQAPDAQIWRCQTIVGLLLLAMLIGLRHAC